MEVNDLLFIAVHQIQISNNWVARWNIGKVSD